MVIMLMSLFLLNLHVSRRLPFVLTPLLTSLTFLTIILALTRAFGDAGSLSRRTSTARRRTSDQTSPSRSQSASVATL
jgi:hypothetical protein